MDRLKATPAAYLILEKDGKVLSIRRYNTGYRDGEYSLPAGHLEEGELPSECILREAQEEVGIKIKSEDLEFVCVHYRLREDQTGERIDFFFVADNWEGEPKIMELDKNDDLQWFYPDNLPKNMVPYVKSALDCYK